MLKYMFLWKQNIYLILGLVFEKILNLMDSKHYKIEPFVLHGNSFFMKLPLREKCLYSELFWSAFSRIRTEYGPEKLRIRTLFTHCTLKHEFLTGYVYLLVCAHFDALLLYTSSVIKIDKK